MLYELIFTEFQNLFNASIDSWIFTGVEILSFITCVIFIIMFATIPIGLFVSFLSLLSATSGKRKRWR